MKGWSRTTWFFIGWAFGGVVGVLLTRADRQDEAEIATSDEVKEKAE